MDSEYKKAKVAFVSDTTGSSIFHVNLISAVALTTIALHSALRTRLPSSRSIIFPVSFTILVIPLLLSMTTFATSPALLSLLLLIPTAILILLPQPQTGSPLPSLKHSPQSPRADGPTRKTSSDFPPAIPLLPALTTYRAHMILMTVIAILAVDFPVFPRALAKCETFGVSLMDLGVGSFVFSQGVVSALPMLKNPAFLTAPLGTKLLHAIRKSLPVLALGIGRVILVKGVEYPEHETEYGTHWNFFLTLALLPIAQVALHPVILRVPISLLGVLVAVAHQMMLSPYFFNLQHVLLNSPRSNLILANKEGIISITGYLAIQLLGLSTGTLLIPPSPSYFRRRQVAYARSQKRGFAEEDREDEKIKNYSTTMWSQREDDKTATELCAYAALWWIGVSVCGWLKLGGSGEVSRRMANLPYILWVVAFNTSFLLAYTLLDLVFFPSPLSKSMYSPTSKLKLRPSQQQQQQQQRHSLDSSSGYGSPTAGQTATATTSTAEWLEWERDLQRKEGCPPPLLEAINQGGFPVFLGANLLTGLVNVTLPTMYMSDRWAMVVLVGYTFVVCAGAWMWRVVKRKR